MLTLAPPPHTGRAYLGWLSTQRCGTCGVHGVHLHHLSMWGLPRRTGNALRDYTTVPLCPTCHQTGRHAAHRCGPWTDDGNHGQAAWARLHALDLEGILLAQYRRYATAHWLPLPLGPSARAAAEWLRSREMRGSH